MDWIELTECELSVVVGVLPEEQLTPQPVRLQVSLGLELGRAGDADRLDWTVDYAAVLEQVDFLMSHGRWRLLETAAVAILRHLLAPPLPGEGRAPVEVAQVRLQKPTILGGRATPGVWLRRRASWAVAGSRPLAEGVRGIRLVANESVDAWRVELTPGTSFHLPEGGRGLCISGAVVGQGTRIEPGPVRAGDDGAGLLIVSRPPLV